LEANLILVEKERSDRQKEFTTKRVAVKNEETARLKGIAAEQKKIDDDALAAQKLKAEEEKKIADKKIADTQKLQDQIEILQAEGTIREALQLQQAYDAELALIADNEDAKVLLFEKYRLLNEELKQKTDSEALQRQKAINEKDLADTKALEEAKREIRLEGVEGIRNIGQTLQDLAGKNKKLALAGLFIEKALSIGEIIANTSKATAKAISVSPLTFGLPWSAVNIASGALGVTNVIKSANDAAGQINTAQIPKYASGTDFHPGGDMIVGEKGIEILKNVPSGAQVLNNPDTISLLSQYTTREEVLGYIKDIVAIPVIIDENGSYKSANLARKVDAQVSRYIK